MITIIKNSFKFKNLFGLRKHKSVAYVFYFILMVLLSLLPQNLQIIKNDGFEFNNIVIELNEIAETDPKQILNLLPEGVIEKTYFLNESTIDTVIKTKTFTIEFYKQGEVSTEKKNLVAFEYDKVVYYDGNGNKLEGSYRDLDTRLNLSYLKDLSKYGIDENNEPVNQTELALQFVEVVKKVFSPYFIAQGISVTLIGNYALNIALLFLICLIFLLIRINYKKVASYVEYLRIYIAAFTLPVIIGVVLGLISYQYLSPFSQVIIQWGTPAMAIGAVFIGSKKERKEKEQAAAEKSEKERKNKTKKLASYEDVM